MMKRFHHVLAFCFSCLFTLHVFAEAPVVDDSENFAILDEQAADNPPPVAKARNKYNDSEEEIALAQDNDIDQGSNVDLLSKLKSMQQEIQELRGQLEIQTHELQVLKQQQLTFYKDIDTRLGNSTKNVTQSPITPKASLESTATNNNLVSTAVTNGPRTNNPADEQISYLAAYDLVKNKRFDEALLSMHNFVSQYPTGGYTANAQYWLGELYMVKKNYPQAINHFELVLKNFSTSSKAPASSLKIGYALLSSGKKEEAKQRLQQVIHNYPDTPTAQLAAAKLMTINAS